MALKVIAVEHLAFMSGGDGSNPSRGPGIGGVAYPRRSTAKRYLTIDSPSGHDARESWCHREVRSSRCESCPVLLPVVRVSYEAVRLIVFSSGGDNEVPKLAVGVVGCLRDVFGAPRRWLCGNRSSRDDQFGDTVCVGPVPSCDLSHDPYEALSVGQTSDRDLFSQIARCPFPRCTVAGCVLACPSTVRPLGGGSPAIVLFVVL